MNFDNLNIPKHIKKIVDESLNDQVLCVRFPPEPNGFLHLGHMFASKLNQSIAKVYNGKFIVRFDDTNPELESEEFEQVILEDMTSTGLDLTNLTHTSDTFGLLIEKATELVKLGWAYVDNSTHDELAKQRKDFVGSKCRELSVEENLERWNGMISGAILNMSLRLKAFPDSKNGAMRDPVLYRTLTKSHHRTGTTFKIYPTYDFACPILDSVDDVTHIFRSKEYCERDEQMKFILGKLSMRIPMAITYGRLNVENSELSKRKIKYGIETGLYTGWDDKKLFTLRGMRNRGLSLEGISKLLDDVGFPESNITIQQQKIFTINRKVIDKNAVRLIGISLHDIKELDINIQTDVVKQVPNFIKNKELGERIVTLSNKIIVSEKELKEFVDKEELTLIYIGNAIFNAGESSNKLNLHLEGNPATTSKKILWLNLSNVQNVVLEMLDGTNIDCFVEAAINNVKTGDYLNLNKIGYFYKKIDSLEKIILVQI